MSIHLLLLLFIIIKLAKNYEGYALARSLLVLILGNQIQTLKFTPLNISLHDAENENTENLEITLLTLTNSL